MVTFDGEREETSLKKKPRGNEGDSGNTHSRGCFFPALKSEKSINLLTLHFTPNHSESIICQSYKLLSHAICH